MEYAMLWGFIKAKNFKVNCCIEIKSSTQKQLIAEEFNAQYVVKIDNGKK